jgi:transposase-like protein
MPSAALPVRRPSHCPYCTSKAVETLAKELTLNTMWRCRACDRAWTITQLMTARSLRGREH